MVATRDVSHLRACLGFGSRSDRANRSRAAAPSLQRHKRYSSADTRRDGLVSLFLAPTTPSGRIETTANNVGPKGIAKPGSCHRCAIAITIGLVTVAGVGWITVAGAVAVAVSGVAVTVPVNMMKRRRVPQLATRQCAPVAPWPRRFESPCSDEPGATRGPEIDAQSSWSVVRLVCFISSGGAHVLPVLQRERPP